MKEYIDDYFGIEDNITNEDSKELLSILYDELECEHSDDDIIKDIICMHKQFEDTDYWMDALAQIESIFLHSRYYVSPYICTYMVYMHILKLKYQNIYNDCIKFYKRILVSVVYKLIILYEENNNIFKSINLDNILDIVIKDFKDNFNISIDKNENKDLLDIEKIINDRKELIKCFFMM